MKTPQLNPTNVHTVQAILVALFIFGGWPAWSDPGSFSRGAAGAAGSGASASAAKAGQAQKASEGAKGGKSKMMLAKLAMMLARQALMFGAAMSGILDRLSQLTDGEPVSSPQRKPFTLPTIPQPEKSEDSTETSQLNQLLKKIASKGKADKEETEPQTSPRDALVHPEIVGALSRAFKLASHPTKKPVKQTLPKSKALLSQVVNLSDMNKMQLQTSKAPKTDSQKPRPSYD